MESLVPTNEHEKQQTIDEISSYGVNGEPGAERIRYTLIRGTRPESARQEGTFAGSPQKVNGDTEDSSVGEPVV